MDFEVHFHQLFDKGLAAILKTPATLGIRTNEHIPYVETVIRRSEKKFDQSDLIWERRFTLFPHQPRVNTGSKVGVVQLAVMDFPP